jgi:hypothetical protein
VNTGSQIVDSNPLNCVAAPCKDLVAVLSQAMMIGEDGRARSPGTGIFL